MNDQTRPLNDSQPTLPLAPGTREPQIPDISSSYLALKYIAQGLAKVDLPLEIADVVRDRQSVHRVHNQLNDYILPRLATLDAPLTVVVGGSTGAGKSTLVNTLLGEAITRSGAIRPTTRQPVLLHRAEDAASLGKDRLLPNIDRLESNDKKILVGAENSAVDQLITVATDAIPAGIALIDAPDIDSVSDDNRRLANQLLEAADLWLFVTTANRYADAVPWEILHRAAARNITIAVVLNRVPEGAEEEIEEDLRRMLEDAGITPAMLMTVTEQERDSSGMIPAAAIFPLVFWLRELGADSAQRSLIARQTLVGAIGQLGVSLGEIASMQQRQENQLQALTQALDVSYQNAQESIVASTQDGALLRGEVLARWQDFVGTGEFFRNLESGISRLRDKLAGFFKGQPGQAVEVEQALEVGLHTVIVEEAENAMDQTVRRWKEEHAGRALLEGVDLSAARAEFPDIAGDVIRDWQQDVMDMIREEGAGKRSRARFMSLGVNAAAVILMVAVFSMTGGLTGIEVGIAGGSGVVGTKLLEAVFGEDAVRRMASRARTNLEERIAQALEHHKFALESVLATVVLEPASQELFAAQAATHTAQQEVGE